MTSLDKNFLTVWATSLILDQRSLSSQPIWLTDTLVCISTWVTQTNIFWSANYSSNATNLVFLTNTDDISLKRLEKIVFGDDRKIIQILEVESNE